MLGFRRKLEAELNRTEREVDLETAVPRLSELCV